MNNLHINFTRQLVKGRIAETIFEQMYRSTGNFVVLEFGYEKIVPELIQSGYSERADIVETLRRAPDFAVIDNRTKRVHLVEVKYRKALDESSILAIAKRMQESWNPSYLFIATLDGFYIDDINVIIENNGKISRLSETNVPIDSQERYLAMLQNFEKNQ